MKKLVVYVAMLLVLTGCAFFANKNLDLNLDALYGKATPQDRVVAALDSGQVDYWSDVKPILESRCISCHACYDAPCQLKLTAIEGIDRGASNEDIYNQSRLRATTPSRLFEDAHTTADWRERNFFPVLNEYANDPEINQEAGVMYKMLELKEENPLPAGDVLPADFSFAVGREHTCATAGGMEDYALQHPTWGMPYGLPQLESAEQEILKRWLTEGARHTAREGISDELQQQVDEWEAFLNRESLKSRLSSRYIYEHLFIAHIYFDEVSTNTFFKIVRSSTPPGEAVQHIATRRPFDDPKVDRVYYRLVPELETIVSKTHLPYAFNEERRDLWTDLFIDADYQIDALPGYIDWKTSNPFTTFEAIPVKSRYKFLLDEAQFTINNFIKGPVCRGQIALNVIQDQFWVFFLDPDLKQSKEVAEFIHTNSDELALANANVENFVPLSTWIEYADRERTLLLRRKEFIEDNFTDENMIDLDLLWDGDGENDNAALTVFRHFNSASVHKGLLGQTPETTWVITYSILERIHYLLVAGFDIYGNVTHQVLSRMHMDFLRIEAESNFLFLLPEESRSTQVDKWYRDTNQACANFVNWASTIDNVESGVSYQTTDYKNELYEKIEARFSPIVSRAHSLDELSDPSSIAQLQRLETFSGASTMFLPEVSVIQLVGSNGEADELVTITRNNGRTNITSLFNENDRLLPAENTVSVSKGVIGSYPNVFLRVDRADLSQFVDTVLSLQSEFDYDNMLDVYGIRRTNQEFWAHSDTVHDLIKTESPIEFGLLDYGRLENR